MSGITHVDMANHQAFEKVSQDMQRCFATWEAAGIKPSLALWAMTVLVTESLRNALDNDKGRVADFMLAAMQSSLKDIAEGDA